MRDGRAKQTNKKLTNIILLRILCWRTWFSSMWRNGRKLSHRRLDRGKDTDTSHVIMWKVYFSNVLQRQKFVTLGRCGWHGESSKYSDVLFFVFWRKKTLIITILLGKITMWSIPRISILMRGNRVCMFIIFYCELSLTVPLFAIIRTESFLFLLYSLFLSLFLCLMFNEPVWRRKQSFRHIVVREDYKKMMVKILINLDNLKAYFASC